MKKKLTILSHSLGGGGAERVVSYLLEGLKKDYHLTLVLLENSIAYEIPHDIVVHFLDNAKKDEKGIVKLLKLPYLGWKYKQFCKSSHADISLAFMNRPSYISIFAKLFGSKVKTIISERSTPSMLYGDASLPSRASRILIKRLYPLADLIISNSKGNRSDLIENFDISPASIRVLYNPLNLTKIMSLAATQNHNLIDFDRFTYIAVGRLDQGKNHRLLINAFTKIENKNTQLLILGEGPLKKTLERQIVTLKLEKRVFLIGFNSNPYQYMTKADAFVLSSNYEGFPNVLIEALACGLPVISTDCKSGPREILAPQYDIHSMLVKDVVEVEYGILVRLNSVKALAEAMSRVIENQKLYCAYKNKAKRRAMDFEVNKLLQKWISQIESLWIQEYSRKMIE